MVTPVEASEDASIWHRPSKIPPGSMTMHGECTSPVTTPFAWISTRPFAKITPSKRPEITTRLPSICPSTFAPSPKTTVCSEMIFPRTLPSMRNVPVSCSVPSRVTPWSIKPVHSSLTPFFEEPGHFHAMTFLLKLERLSYSSVRCAQVNAPRMLSCPKDTVERMDRLDYCKDCGSTSSIDRKFPLAARRRNIPARAAQDASSSSAGGGLWFPGAAGVRRLRLEYLRLHESGPRGLPCANVATRGVQSAGLLSRRAKLAAHNAFLMVNPLQPAALARALR